jgi:hypothetical protein
MRRIDLYLVPWLSICYLLSFLGMFASLARPNRGKASSTADNACAFSCLPFDNRRPSKSSFLCWGIVSPFRPRRLLAFGGQISTQTRLLADCFRLRLPFALARPRTCLQTAIGNAKTFGLERDLNLTPQQYNIALTIFFFPYAIAEPLTNVLLKKLSPRWFLSGILVLWAVAMTARLYTC